MSLRQESQVQILVVVQGPATVEASDLNFACDAL